MTLALLLPPSPVICIDPGHPSETSDGCRGKKITEKRLAWQTAVRLKRALILDGYTVVMTKGSETERVTNRHRAEIANMAKAVLFLRLHADAGRHTGFATYFPARAATLRGFRGPSQAVIAASTRFSRPFHLACVSVLHGWLADYGCRTEAATGVAQKQGALTGSVYSKVPVLLVEMCVLTNPKDEAFVMSRQGEEKMTQALLAGVHAVIPVQKR